MMYGKSSTAPDTSVKGLNCCLIKPRKSRMKLSLMSLDLMFKLLITFIIIGPKLASSQDFNYDEFNPLTPAIINKRHKYVDTNLFGECFWTVHFSTLDHPTDLKSTYFNEAPSSEVKELLMPPFPDTIHLHRPVIRGEVEGFFGFPYFLILIPHCDDGDYGFKVYDFILQNNFPVAKLFYTPASSRDVYRNIVRMTLRGALVELNENLDNGLMEKNPAKESNAFNNGSSKLCHKQICYPAFVIPQPFLHFPIFSVTISSLGLFQDFEKHVYVTPYHSRKDKGVGTLEIARRCILQINDTIVTGFCNSSSTDDITSSNNVANLDNTIPTTITTDIHASHFFPTQAERISETEDVTLNKTTVKNELFGHNLSTLNDRLVKFANAFNYTPLDIDDFFEPQYSFLSSPVVAIAGFYRPDLVLLGDPDLAKFELFQWDFNEGDDGTIFEDAANSLQCYTPDAINFDRTGESHKLPKLMYTQGEIDEIGGGPDGDEFRYYYRRRYAPMNYSSQSPKVHGIFQIISFADRLLITTSSGLVSFYGSTNKTVSADKVFKAFPNETLRGCFKFVRTVKRTLQQFDPIVAVTYTYDQKVGNEIISANQDIWYGKLTDTSGPIVWTKISRFEHGTPNIKDSRAVPSLGITAETEDESEVIKICNLVKKLKIDSRFIQPDKRIKFAWKTHPSMYQCTIIDGTPIPTRPDAIQLLVKMSFVFFQDGVDICDLVLPDNTLNPSCLAFDLDNCLRNRVCDFSIQRIVLYVVAEHVVHKKVERGESWTITSVIPRVPCVVPHLESIRTLPLFEADLYFKPTGTTRILTCFEEFAKFFEENIYVDHMTYTRQASNHMFLYGRSFLHSSDAGQSFVFSRKFPPPLPTCLELSAIGDCVEPIKVPTDEGLLERYANVSSIPVNKVMTMAFASNSKYAVLTSARELFVGSTGHATRIKVRPNLGYGVSNLRQYSTAGMHEAIPFTIMFDSFNNLFEMVAVVDNDGKVTGIEKRGVNLDWNQRHQNFAEKLLTDLEEIEKNRIKNGSTGNLPDKFWYNITEYNVYCPFNQFESLQNYSKKFRRLQLFFLNPPLQHRKFGNTNTEATLINYQVSSHSLVYDAFLRDHINVYSRVDKDPFQEWKDVKGDAAQIAYLKFNRKDHKQFGVIVEPRLNNREDDLKDSARKILMDMFFLDLNVIIEFKLSFIIKSSFLPGATDFSKHKTSHIQLNIENANSDLVSLTTERLEVKRELKVEFVSLIQLKKNDLLRQSLPGSALVSIPIDYHFVGSFSKCFDLPHYGMKGDSISFQVFAGCPPANDLLFNWNSTLTSLRFRHQDEHYGDESYCLGSNRVCFYAKRDMTFNFETLDFTKQIFVPFEGLFKMRVIAGGYTNDTMVSYTEEEQEAYNIQGKSDVSLIWTTAGLDDNNETQRAFQNLTKDPKTQESVLRAGKTRIMWSCNTLSPCQRIAPSFTGRTVFWFKIRISNRDVDQDTLCLHERTFDIMVYGFPPSPEILLFVTLAFSLFTLFLLYLLFVCCRNHRKVWRANKLKLWGWCLIVIDTFPKPLKTKMDAEKEQAYKDEILLSLQGHLNVPMQPQKPKQVAMGDTLGEPRTPDRSESKVSFASDTSSATGSVSKDGLPSVKTRKAPATWTDMIYEQIISRRLLSIVERNKRMHESILRKVDLAELQKQLEKSSTKDGTAGEGLDDDDDEDEEEKNKNPSQKPNESGKKS